MKLIPNQFRSAAPALDAPRRVWLFGGVVAVLALVVAFVSLGNSRTLTSHEAFLAVSTREMLATGDWLVPRFGRLLRLTKPPLGYWSALGPSWLLGETSEFTARLPSAISSLVLASIVGLWAARWYGRTAGICAALVQVTSLYHILHAREATVDMLQCTLMTAAMFLVAHQPEHESRAVARRRWFGIYLLLGVLSLAKFHFGPMLVLAPIPVFWLVERRFRSFLNLCNPAGILVCAAIGLAWPAYVLRQVPDAILIWQHETLGRVMGEMRPEPAWYFLPLVPYLVLPWAILLPWAARESWQRSCGPVGSRERFLWLWIVVQVTLISLSSNKHKNYVIPALPAVAILLGPTLERALGWIQAERRRNVWLTGMAIACVAIAGAATTLIVIRKWPHLQGPMFGFGSLISSGGCATLLALHWRRYAAAGVLAAGLYAALQIAVFGWLIPGRDYRRPVADFAAEVRRQFPSEDICVYALGQSQVVFYLDLPVHRSEDLRGLQGELRRAERGMLVITTPHHQPELWKTCDVDVVHAVSLDDPRATSSTEDLLLLRVTPRNALASEDHTQRR